MCRVCGKRPQGNWFDCQKQWTLGDGKSVKFWKGSWADGKVLKEAFPRLFSISQCKENDVCDLVDWGQSWSGKCTS